MSFDPELTMGKQEIQYGTESSGVGVEYTKRRRSVYVCGAGTTATLEWTRSR